MPISSDIVPLIDMNGTVAHQWDLGTTLGLSAYLLPGGKLLATYTLKNDYYNENGSNGGGIEILDWNGSKEWSYELSNGTYHLNHDVAYMNDGDILAIAYERVVGSNAIALGFDPSYVDAHGEVWLEAILEINTSDNQIVWTWHAKDHLGSGINELDPSYVPNKKTPDWLHFNSIDYNDASDEILVSSRNLNEFYIIDHKTGAILYRYGNPAAYKGSGAQTLFGQHDVHWIDPNSASSDILLFDNGNKRTRPYSTVLELKQGSGFGKADIVWTYGNGSGDRTFFSDHLGSAQRLSNGDTLICTGTEGGVFEINGTGQVVWNYTNSEFGKDTPKGFNGALFRATRYPKDYPGIPQ